MPTILKAQNTEKSLKKLGTKEKAKSSAWFFKTGKGHYGYGDVFVGVSVPEQRKVAKEYKGLPLAEIGKLLKNKIHECRLTALLILAWQFRAADEKGKAKIAKFYLARAKNINNWDLVDVSAGGILGEYLFGKDRRVLYKLAKSKNLWERRISIVATFAFIRKKDFTDTFLISERLFSDKHDLIHKAVGWMLREVGKQSKPALVRFLKLNAKNMPRTSLRYAIERFPESERKKFLGIKKSA